MFNFNLRYGFVAGLLVGAFIAIVAVAAIFFGASRGTIVQLTSSTNEFEQANQQIERWWLVPRIIYMDDTIAQWIMTFSTIVATYLLLKTLWATQRMAAETTRIGDAQVRAYLDVELMSFSFDDDRHPTMKFRIRNLGQTPAVNIVLKTRARYEGESELVVKEDCTKVRDISGGSETLETYPMVLLAIPFEAFGDNFERFWQAKFFIGVFAFDIFGKPIEVVRMFRRQSLSEGEIFTMAADRWGEATKEKFDKMVYRPGPKARGGRLKFIVPAGPGEGGAGLDS